MAIKNKVKFLLRATFRAKILLCKNILNGVFYDANTIYVLSYDGLTNIGDEIQSISVRDILLDYKYTVKYIHREKLSAHFSFFKRRVILNGWFSHDSKSFPPSRSLVPIFIGFHLANKDILSDIDFFKKNEPIGARDKGSVDIFRSMGIKSYYSSCPTLTLKRRNSKVFDKCLIVDAHLNNPDGHTSDARVLLNMVLDKYNIRNVEKVSQNCAQNLNNLQKTLLAEKRLVELCESSLVITNRIHIALPCLAMNVPVIFVHRDPWDDKRISSFLDYFWYATDTKTNLPDSIDVKYFTNKNTHEKYAINLKSTILAALK